MTMMKFEDLPEKNRALILVKLALELQIQGLATMHELARARHTDLTGVWRYICRKAGQPLCTLPIETMYEHQ
jgi:hypothetical protein